MITSKPTPAAQIEALQVGVENTLATLTKAPESVSAVAQREKPLAMNEMMRTLSGKQMARELTEYEASIELRYALLDADENALKSLIRSAQEKSHEAEVAVRHSAGCIWNLVLFAAAAEMLAGVVQMRAIGGLV